MITLPIFQKHRSIDQAVEYTRLLGTLSAVFISIASLTIFQDFLESNRRGYAFYFSESILFKCVWLLFIPILALLYKTLKTQQLSNLPKTLAFVIIPIIVHYTILPFIVLVFSVLFYDGRYDLYKMFTYTLSNDLYKLVLIYSAFVLTYKHLSTLSANDKPYLDSIVINNGKDNIIIKVNEILQITAATPYITIQLKDKKHLYTGTLKSISEQLDNRDFVRVHKSAIVNINKVVSFKSRLNGDYDLLLTNGEEVRLSRTYAAGFKKRL